MPCDVGPGKPIIMADWSPEQPRKLLDLLRGLLLGDKPEIIKSNDEYGRSYTALEDPAVTAKRIKEQDAS
jgi:hypothetical protein